MATDIDGYPTSPLERFVTGLNTGWQNMNARIKEANDLKIQNQQFDLGEMTRKQILDAEKKKQEDNVKKENLPAGANPSSGGSAGSATGGGGEVGEFAAPVVNYFKSLGWNDNAIAGAIANGMAEGKFSNNWTPGDNGSSFGHWQFHKGGEYEGYIKFLQDNKLDPNDPAALHDSVNQAKYFAQRMTQIDPNYGQIGDAKAATDLVMSKFERPAKQYNVAGARYSFLPGAQQYLANPPAPSTANMAIGSPELQTAAPDYNRAMQMPLPSEQTAGATPPAIGAPP